MHLFYAELVRQRKCDDIFMFNEAHIWFYKTDEKIMRVINDVCQYKLHGILPKYVIAYMKYLQRR